MKGKIFAVMIAAVIGFSGVQSASAQRQNVTVNGPHGSVQVSNTGYGNGYKHSTKHHYKQHRHHGPRSNFRERHQRMSKRHHAMHAHHRHHAAKHRAYRGYK